ncbi:MAG: hypothetical protein V1796_05240, partial [Pseudomonadota bacterium]
MKTTLRASDLFQQIRGLLPQSLLPVGAALALLALPIGLALALTLVSTPLADAQKPAALAVAQKPAAPADAQKPAAPAVAQKPAALAVAQKSTAPADAQKTPAKPFDVKNAHMTICGYCHADYGRAGGKSPMLMNSPRTDEYLFNVTKNGLPGKMAG